MSKTLRTVEKIATSHQQTEGGGFIVRRPLPSYDFRLLDPFLLIDEMGPANYGPGEAVGAPDHPHRGFETVTYMLDGEFEHEDSAGHKGKIKAGDVQWMTAGAGVVHSEMPSQTIRKDGGRVHGFQIWVNLPAKLKMTAPRYQEIPAAQIPTGTSEDGLASVQVIAGQALGQSAVIDTHTPIHYHDWTLRPGAEVQTDLPEEFNAGIFVFSGRVQIGDPNSQKLEWVEDGQFAQLGSGNSVHFSIPKNEKDHARFLLLAGKPIGEPVARYGPFVMNTQQELQQAFLDYQNGQMGLIQR